MTSFRLGLLVLAVPVLVWAVIVVSPADPPRSGATTTPAPAATRADPSALRVLRDWDRRRSAAYAAGSPRLLRDLYVAGARSGAADVRVLDRYVARGWRVTGMRMQVVAVRVLEQRPARLRLEVVDRLAGAVAVRPGRRVTLPRDRASTRRITLIRGGGDVWRVAAVVLVR